MFPRPVVRRFWKERSVAEDVEAGVTTRRSNRRRGWRQPPLHRPKFSLQRRASFGTFQNVRTIVAIGIICFGISNAFAQKQERRLIDRLLKPDLELANPAQNKKFSDKHSASFDKPARTATFYSGQKPVRKSFPGERSLTPRQFAARHFRAGDSAAYISSRSLPPKSDTMIVAPVATAGSRIAPESNESAPVREYADNRPFLGKGKSEKALHAQDKPLTIEQVRELLNKSK